MGPVLNGLLKLQSVENRLRAEKAKLTRCRRNVVIQENLIRSLQNALEAKKEEMQLTKLQFDRLELELKSRDETIARLRASLNTAKSNKEYAAVLTQLNTTKADSSKIESQSLELMKDIEADDVECKDIQRQIGEQKGTLERTRKESESLSVKFEAEIDIIQAEWDEAARTIPRDVLEKFKRVAETYDGQAVAVVEQQEGKQGAYSCGGCFMGVTAECVNLLMTKDEIIRCANCTRILVLGNSLES
ncbi:MAG TPA: C4-type zinc ribbon domain-containing protein [Sedimentisphaerales bacterium]|nr:C4-type zinc ribbon domain-containing protein [Sedimentisphaerales bacterium]